MVTSVLSAQAEVSCDHHGGCRQPVQARPVHCSPSVSMSSGHGRRPRGRFPGSGPVAWRAVREPLELLERLCP